MARVKTIKRNSLQQFLVVILSIILALGAIFGIGAIVTSVEEETQTTISPWKFSDGSLTPTGIYSPSTSCIYTEELISCDGLEIELDFENEISYKIYFYKEDGSFLDKTISLKTNFSLYDLDENGNLISKYQDARYCRIVIQPDTDKSVAFYEVYKYAKQLTIKVNKVQFPVLDND